MNRNLEIEVYYHLKKDFISKDKNSRAEFRKYPLHSSIHIFVQNIWKDSENIEDFIVKLIMVYITELTCGFTHEVVPECVKNTKTDIYYCPFLEFFGKEFEKEYNIVDMKKDEIQNDIL